MGLPGQLSVKNNIGVSESAVKARVFRAKTTLGARNSVHAAALAFELGLLDEEIAA